nr:MAG TPA: tail spike protein [Bacteriophage sp.]
MSDIFSQKISELQSSTGPSENAYFPLSEANNDFSEKVSITTLRETIGFENAFPTIAIALLATKESDVFFVYEDDKKENVLGYVNQGNGSYSALMTDSNTQLRYATSSFVVNSLFFLRGAESFEELRTIKPWYEGQRIKLKSYYVDGLTGGGEFVARLTAGVDDAGFIAAGSGYYWERSLNDAFVFPEYFGAIGDSQVVDDVISGVDDTVPLKAFFNFLSSNRVKGSLKAGALYGVSEAINVIVGDYDFILEGNGGGFVQLNDTTVISLQNTTTNSPKAVSEISVVSYNLGDASVNSIVNRFVSDGHGFKKGDIVKVFSDDVCPDKEKDTQFIGEFFVVGDVVDENTFVSTGVVLENYTTGIKVVKPKTANLDIKNLTFVSTLRDGFNASLFTVRGFISPVIENVAVFNVNGVFLSLTSCYHAKVNGIKGRVLKNDPSTNSYGYLVNDSSSYYSEIIGVDCIEARHAYTTTSANAVAGDDRWDLRGRTIGSVIRNSWAQGCHCAFDTHSPAYGIQFINCIVEDNFRGVNVGGAGIQIRGNNCAVINCTVKNSKYGIALSSASKTSDSSLRIDGFVYSGANGNIPVNLSGSTTQKITVVFRGGEISTGNTQCIVLNDCQLEISGLKSNISSVNNGASVLSVGQNTIVTGDLTAAFSGSANTHSIVTHTATNSQVILNTLKVTGVANGLRYLDSSASQYDIIGYYRNVLLDAPLPGIAFSGYPTTAPKVGAEITIYPTMVRPLAYRAISYGTAQSVNFDLQFPLDDVIVVRLTVTADGVVVGSMSRGGKVGQVVHFNNSTNSTSSIAFTNSSANLLTLGQTTTIAPNSSLSIYWDGSTWRKI